MLPLLGLFIGISLGAVTDEFEMHSKYHWYCCEDCKECRHRRNCEDFGEYVEEDEKYEKEKK